MTLKIEQATVKISGFTILRRVSLEAPSGTVVGLIGRNGAGKTPTPRTMMGLVELESGRVQLDRQDFTHLAPHMRGSVGSVTCPKTGG